ncbi:MAG TPA: DEAD/DEAH box helicase family protein [Terriglobales bacterium]|jgi:type III restriction enzyme
MDIRLKDFQKTTLDKLKEFLEKTRLVGDPAEAFVAAVHSPDGRVPVYQKQEGLERVPYVCLRLPTGGGKTIVGAYAIRTAAQSYIEKDYPVVLWLVPTKTIRTQTATALKDTRHPYRKALDGAFEGRVRVFDISEIENIRPQDLLSSLCVVVGTIQTLRVENTEGRDVYAHKEALEDHFTRMKVSVPGLERIEEGPNAGQVKYSFANLMAIHHPMVIVDEAHNARTGLSFDALRRVSPSCIVELTATPDTKPGTGSNVLHRVSASELKAEEMIKLPIVLTVHENSWQEAVGDALRTRKRLADLATGEVEYVRPILLIQAENKDRPANVDAVKKYLLESENLPEERIAVATGEQRELDGINLFDPQCLTEVIITVQALKEGWDCSFAYVFCSAANIGSGRDVEQLLGRVLRMPYARRRKAPELNKAYAHVSSPNFVEAAKQLETSMIAMGFEDVEVEQYIEVAQPSLPNLPLFLQGSPLTLTLEQTPNTEGLSERERQSIIVTGQAPGRVAVEVHGEVTERIKERLLSAVPQASKPETEKAISEYLAGVQVRWSPAQRGERFTVPRLCVQYQGQLELVDHELLLDAAGWNLLDYAPELDDFRFNDTTKTFEFDVDGSRVVYHFMVDFQLDLNLLAAEWTPEDLVRWLDKQLRKVDIRQETLAAWLDKAVRQLLRSQRIDLATLVRAKFILARKLEDKINQYRKTAYDKGYQELLFEPNAAVVTSYEDAFSYPSDYPANWWYNGRHKFTKHYYAVPGELQDQGEEYECAMALDMQSGVRHWVRNLAKQQLASLWLQTATDRFYPDFVAELTDGRLLVVEYKGALTAELVDTEEKRRLGKLWESKSNGRALFLIAERRDSQGRGVYDQIKAKIEESFPG